MSSDPSDDLAARVARLEAAVFAAGDRTDSEPDSAAEGLSGMLEYSGSVDFTGPVTWNIAYSADATLDLAPETTANVFAALGHPARVEIVRIPVSYTHLRAHET